MRVSLIAPDLDRETTTDHLIAQARLFHERGDEVCLVLPDSPTALPDALDELAMTPSESGPPSDLYIYHLDQYPPPPSLRQRDEGLVLIHDHDAASVSGREQDDWLPAHFADLCLVDNAARRDELANLYGLPLERICLLPQPDQEEAYRNTLVGLVDGALADDWPPAPQVEKTVVPETATEATPGWSATKGVLKLAQSQADVMQRDYGVRSRIPLLGGLVAWLRRNLTSHLREPYLDPTLERQVAFNRTVVTWMEQVQAQLERLESEIQRLGERTPSVGEADKQVEHDG